MRQLILLAVAALCLSAPLSAEPSSVEPGSLFAKEEELQKRYAIIFRILRKEAELQRLFDEATAWAFVADQPIKEDKAAAKVFLQNLKKTTRIAPLYKDAIKDFMDELFPNHWEKAVLGISAGMATAIIVAVLYATQKQQSAALIQAGWRDIKRHVLSNYQEAHPTVANVLGAGSKTERPYEIMAALKREQDAIDLQSKQHDFETYIYLLTTFIDTHSSYVAFLMSFKPNILAVKIQRLISVNDAFWVAHLPKVLAFLSPMGLDARAIKSLAIARCSDASQIYVLTYRRRQLDQIAFLDQQGRLIEYERSSTFIPADLVAVYMPY